MEEIRMKFSINRESFLSVLTCIDGVCPQKGSSFAALASCVIEAQGKRIIVTGTDLELTLRVIGEADVTEEGKAVINAHQLLETVTSQPFGSEIHLTSTGTQTTIEAANFCGRLSNIDINEYPQVDSLLEIKPSVKMNAMDFKSLINRTMFSISKDDSRIDFTGAFMTIKPNGKIELVSTDGHRLSRAESTANIVGDLHKNFENGVILPKKALSELNKRIASGDVGLDYEGKRVIVSFGDMAYQITPIMGNFPDFSKVIPAQLEHKAIVKREAFMQILKRASIFANKTAGTIKISMTSGKLEVNAYDQIKGEMRDFIDADYDGKGVDAGFNWSYINDVLGVVESEEVSLEIIDMDSPAVIRDVTNDKLDFIVMPMQL